MKIAILPTLDLTDSIDVIAVIQDPGLVEQVHLRSGQQKERRVCLIVDDSNCSINFTIWGKNALDPCFYEGNIIGIKGAKISEFNGSKQLSNSFNTQLLTDLPNTIPEVQ